MAWSPKKWLAEFKKAQKARAERWEKKWNERKWLVRTDPSQRRRRYAFVSRGQMTYWLAGHMESRRLDDKHKSIRMADLRAQRRA